jgi:hypothetical protein
VVTWLTALLADPPQDELPADEVVPDLFQRVPLGVEEDRQRFVAAIPGAARAGNSIRCLMRRTAIVGRPFQ